MDQQNDEISESYLAYRQLKALLYKNYLVKKRLFCQTFCEIFTPLIVCFLILFGFGLSTIDNIPASIYSNQSLPFSSLSNLNVDITPALVTQLTTIIQNNPPSIYTVPVNENCLHLTPTLCVNISSTVLSNLTNTVFQSLNITGLNNTGLILDVLNYNGPTPVYTFDAFVTLAMLVQFFTQGLPSATLRAFTLTNNMYGNLLNLGFIIVTPRNQYTDIVVKEMKRQSVYFTSNYLNDTLIITEDDAVKYALSQYSDTIKRTWAVVNFQEVDFNKYQFSYSIRMNYSIVTSTKRTVARSARVLDLNYKRYFFSGFLSIQNLVDSSILAITSNLTSNFSSSSEVNFQSNNISFSLTNTPLLFSGTPFPTPGSNSNQFYSFAGPLFGMILVMSSLYPISRLIKGLVEEKESRIKETMKIMGLKNYILYSSWYITYFLIFTLLAILIAILLSPVFPKTPKSLIFGLLLLFFYSEMTMGFLISVFFNKSKLASIMGPLLLFASMMPRYIFINTEDSELVSYKIISCFISPTSFIFAMDLIVSYESANLSLSGSSLYSDPLPFSTLIIIICFDIFLYAFLAWFLEQVLPNEYGTKRPFFFLCSSEYWNPIKKVNDLDNPEKSAEFHKLLLKDNLSNSMPSIQIRSLRKEYDSEDGFKKVAIHSMDLDIYESQITAVLGHNGAGKTTLISVLTGLVESSGGEAYVNGLSMTYYMDKIRNKYGICPQHDILFPVLTVEEHLELFASLRAVPAETLEANITTMIEDVGLTEKRDVFSQDLSGGMKRKLSIAMAFMGNPSVVFCDEPTSGMDPYSRRSTWNLLRKLTPGKTIILTTHFLDEAELLSDRIAIMAEGRLLCHGSSLFLKTKYGCGYTLTISKNLDSAFDVSKIQTIILSLVPTFKLLSDAGAELSYQLPLNYANKFSALLEIFENNMTDLGIRSYGISMTTLEDVFLAINSGTKEIEEIKPEKNVEVLADSKVEINDPHFFSVSIEKDDVIKSASNIVSPVSFNIELSEAKPDLCRNYTPIFLHNLPDCYNATENIDSFKSEDILSMKALGSTAWEQFKQLLYKRYHCGKRDLRGRFFEVIMPIIVIALVMLILIIDISPAGPSLPLTTKRLFTSPTEVPISNGNLTNSSSFSANLYTWLNVPTNLAIKPISSNNDTELSLYLLASFYSNNNSRWGAYSSSSTANTSQALNITNILSNLNITAIDNALNTTLLEQILRLNLAPIDLSGNTTNSLGVSILHNSTSYHALPAFVNEVTVAKLRSIIYSSLEDASGKQLPLITANNAPLPLTELRSLQLRTILALFSALFVLVPFCYLPASYTIFIVRERAVKSKHLQLVSGVKPWIYWVSTYTWDMFNYLFVCCGAMIIFAAFNNPSFVGTASQTGATFLLFFLYGLACLPLSYCYSFAFDNYSSSQIGVAGLHFTTGFILVLLYYIMNSLPQFVQINASLVNYYRLLPPFVLGESMLTLATLALVSSITGRQKNPFDRDVLGNSFIFLAVESVVYFLITLMLEYNVFGTILKYIKLQLFGESIYENYTIDDTADLEDSDVKLERRDALLLDKPLLDSMIDSKKPAVLVHHLRKEYSSGLFERVWGFFSGSSSLSAESKVAVKDLCLSVPTGQAFGLLGINGAGKSTTLNMLTGDSLPSNGSAYINGIDVVNDVNKARQDIGFCPQWDPLLSEMTARETLSFFAFLRGLPHGYIPDLVIALLDRLSLQNYADQPCGGYSGGNKRKLSLGIALIGNPSVIFLDEPSTGMDPKARRFMWTLIQDIAKTHCVILTTHSMAECEATCTRLCIMVSGRLTCLGTPQHIKSVYGEGFALEIKTLPGQLESAISWIKSVIPGSEPEEWHGSHCKLKIPKTSMSLSKLFAILEENKNEHYIEEYGISQASLEQVFVTLAKHQKEEVRQVEGLL